MPRLPTTIRSALASVATRIERVGRVAGHTMGFGLHATGDGFGHSIAADSSALRDDRLIGLHDVRDDADLYCSGEVIRTRQLVPVNDVQRRARQARPALIGGVDRGRRARRSVRTDNDVLVHVFLSALAPRRRRRAHLARSGTSGRGAKARQRRPAPITAHASPTLGHRAISATERRHCCGLNGANMPHTFAAPGTTQACSIHMSAPFR